MSLPSSPLVAPHSDDTELVRLARQGDGHAVRALVQKYNRRLFRIARAVLSDDAEAEDALQDGYLKAFTRLGTFRGEAQFSTWLTRIVINEARARVRRRRPTTRIDDADEAALQPEARVIPFPHGGGDANPEVAAARTQVRELIERGVDRLPEDFRVVLVMRDVEGMSVEETASSLKVNPATIKTRLFRARRLMREALKDQLQSSLTGSFPFGGRRCARTADAVLTRLAAQHLTR